MQVEVVKSLSTVFAVGTVAQLLTTSTRGDFCLTIGKISEFFEHAYRSHVEEIYVATTDSLDTWERTCEEKIIDTNNLLFETWWKRFYGAVDEYEEADEYYVRKAFAYFGWLAFIRPYVTEVNELLRSKV